MQNADDRIDHQQPREGRRAAPGIGASRFTIVLAIAGTIISALSMLVFSLIVVLKTIWDAFKASSYEVEDAKHLAVHLIEMTDFFLLGMVLYVVALGMYQLFIDADVAVPPWMRVTDLSDLKTQLINVIIVVLAVSFLAEAVSWTAEHAILYFGISVAVVILAMAAYNLIHASMTHNDHPRDEGSSEEG